MQASDIPSCVKIGILKVQILLMPIIADDTSLYGRFVSTTPKIELCSDVSIEMVKQTLWHELLHVIEYCYSLQELSVKEKDNNQHEEYIDRVAFGIATMLHDNPELLAFFGSDHARA